MSHHRATACAAALLTGLALVSVLWIPTVASSESSPHVHDLWGERDHVQLLEETVSVDPTTSAVPVELPVRAFSSPATVYPGASHLTVEVSWGGPAADLAEPTLCVRTDGRSYHNCDLGHAGNTFSASNGSWQIPVADGPAPDTDLGYDDPHSRKSGWRFLLEPCARIDVVDTCLPEDRSYHVEITSHRSDGELPLDPAHHDYWANDTTLTLLEAFDVADGPVRASVSPGPLYVVDGPAVRRAFDDGDSEVPIVPPGTRTLDAELRWSSETPSDLQLAIRSTADAWDDPWRKLAPSGDCGTGGEASCEAYDVPVSGLMTDGFYEPQTKWEFGIFTEDEGLPAADPVLLTDHDVDLSVRLSDSV